MLSQFNNSENRSIRQNYFRMSIHISVTASRTTTIREKLSGPIVIR